MNPNRHHYSDVTWVSWHLKSPETQLFNSLFRLTSKKTLHYWPFARGIHQWLALCEEGNESTIEQWLAIWASVFLWFQSLISDSIQSVQCYMQWFCIELRQYVTYLNNKSKISISKTFLIGVMAWCWKMNTTVVEIHWNICACQSVVISTGHFLFVCF